jgi:hypothetical protein
MVNSSRIMLGLIDEKPYGYRENYTDFYGRLMICEENIAGYRVACCKRTVNGLRSAEHTVR